MWLRDVKSLKKLHSLSSISFVFIDLLQALLLQNQNKSLAIMVLSPIQNGTF